MRTVVYMAQRRMGELLAKMEKAVGSDKAGKAALDGARRLLSNPPPTLLAGPRPGNKNGVTATASAHPALATLENLPDLDKGMEPGETLVAMKERGELAENQHCRSQTATATLEDLGLTKSQSSRYQTEASDRNEVTSDE